MRICNFWLLGSGAASEFRARRAADVAELFLEAGGLLEAVPIDGRLVQRVEAPPRLQGLDLCIEKPSV